MRLTTLPNGTRDGMLAVVSSDGTRCLNAGDIAPNLREALEQWELAVPLLANLAGQLDADPGLGDPFDESIALAPLPRTWQWLDASAFLNHGALLSRSLNVEPIIAPVPLIYQGMSHEFLAPRAEVPRWNNDGDLDFEGEFAVVLRDTPAGIDASAAQEYIALIVLVNDWSQRAVVIAEMARKFGYIVGKPATGMAPLAVTPDELSSAWGNGRIGARLHVDLNGERFGEVPADGMDYSFGELIAYAARTRNLAAGTVLGGGTVSSANYAQVGSACISERRGVEILETGAAVTPYLVSGDEVRMRSIVDGRSLFGELAQTVVEATAARK